MNADPAEAIEPSVLGQLRRLIPDRHLSYAETLTLAEQQAATLLRLRGVTNLPVPSEVITGLPRIRVVHHHGPSTGVSHWNGAEWIITLNDRDPRALRRVTLLHEYAHIIWHGYEAQLFSSQPQLAYFQAEQAADHFAWNVLIPAQHLESAWAHGLKHIGELADLFQVREYTVLARIVQLRPWLPAHYRTHPHWSQLLTPAVERVNHSQGSAVPSDAETAI